MDFKKLRKRSGLTQGQVAKRLGVSVQLISNIERGISPVPAKWFKTLAALFNVAIDSFVEHRVRSYRRRIEQEMNA